MLYNKDDVLNFLPHRDPFLFIDSVESIEIADEFKNIPSEELNKKHLIGTVVTAHYEVNPDHPIFEGHFPDQPVLPGVVQVEMMAQASIFLVKLVSTKKEGVPLKVALLNITSAKFRSPVVPGMKLTIKTFCTRIRGSIVCNDCQVFHGDILVAESSNLATIEF